MKRRNFIKSGALAAIAGVSTLRAFALDKISGDVKEVKLSPRYDVLVVGGGTAGVVAAIQSAKLGAKTLLVECTSQLGGTMTNGGVSHPGLFHAWGKQVVSGIGWGLVSECAALNGDTLPDFTKKPERHWHHQIRLNPFLYVPFIEGKLLDSGSQLIYYTTVEDIDRESDGTWEVELSCRGVKSEIKASRVIDCTGSATIAALAGFDRMTESECQPGTQIFHYGNYDLKSLDKDAIRKAFSEAKKSGELKPRDCLGDIWHFLVNAGDNQQHIDGASNADAEIQTATNVSGRASAMRLLRFFRKQRGLENTRILYLAPEAGVRETYRLVGDTIITLEDYVSGKVWADSVSYSFYPIDLHVSHGVEPKPLKEGVVATVPLSALRPKGSDNFLVAGRCVSSDRLANSALRVQASCMGMGQAAGAAAALSVANSVPLSKLEIPLLKKTLAANGAIVP